MPHYTVYVHVTVPASFEVEAKTSQAAEKQAIDLLKKAKFYDFIANPADIDDKYIEVDSVECNRAKQQ